MYPTISDLLRDLLGINIPLPIQSFGFFVALSFLAAAYIFARELKRKENMGLITGINTTYIVGKPATTTELALNAVLGFILGYKLGYALLNYSDFTADPQKFLLSSEGNLLLGLLFAGGMAYWKYYEKKKEQLPNPEERVEFVHPYQQVPNMTMVAMVSGLLGAKLFHNLEYIDDFIKDPIDALLSFSGLTFFGGLIAGAIAVIWYARKRRIPTLHLIDACAPGLILAYAVGRIGCQVAGDGDWGIENLHPKPAALSFLPDWAWAYKYPHNVLSDGVPIVNCIGQHCNELPQPVYPTPLYESIMGFCIFGLLWGIRKMISAPGVMFSIYLFLVGLERFFIEKIRVNSYYHVGTLQFTQAELISCILMLLGIGSSYYFYKKHIKRTENA